tara:strand:- start:184 stop:645 length:462 start_codon:yes stop_codon:yes gene_type:complete
MSLEPGYPQVGCDEMDEVSIDHVGIATNSLEGASEFWEALGFIRTGDHMNEQQGVSIRMFNSTLGEDAGASIELLEPIGPDSPIRRFLANRGEGIQQLAIRVPDIQGTIERLEEQGVRMIDREPIPGAAGTMIAFIHPSCTGGVLVELVEHLP